MPEDEMPTPEQQLRYDIIRGLSDREHLKEIGTTKFYTRFIEGVGKIEDVERPLEIDGLRPEMSSSEAGILYADRIALGHQVDPQRRRADTQLVEDAFKEAQEVNKKVPERLQHAWDMIKNQYEKLDEEERQ